MAGNSRRRGAVRSSGKPRTAGSGGQRRRGLEGKGPTPAAERRPGHPAARRSRSGDKAATRREVILGRNAVDEALASGVPAVELLVGDFLTDDDRTSRAKQAAGTLGIPIVVCGKQELDRRADGLPHQGVVLVVAPYSYAELPDLHRTDGTGTPIVVLLDHLQDPRNLGAIARSCAAFGANGLVIPGRRAVGVTAAAWRTSAGALARIPVARVVNLARALESLRREGYLALGLAATGGRPLPSLSRKTLGQPIALVVGAEDTGLSRLVAQTCDLLVTIPITSTSESLNASVATGIALHAIRNGPGQ